MATLIAVVTALSIAVGANLLLTFAIVRKLRLQQRLPSRQVQLPPVGMLVPTFSVMDYAGKIVDDRFYAEGSAIAAFLSHDCAPCDSAKAELARKPLKEPFVIFLRGASLASEGEFIGPVARAGARVVALDPDSDLLERFAVRAFPTFLRIRDGVVVSSTVRLAEVRQASRHEAARRMPSPHESQPELARSIETAAVAPR